MVAGSSLPLPARCGPLEGRDTEAAVGWSWRGAAVAARVGAGPGKPQVRLMGFEKDLQGSSSPTPLLQQVHPEQLPRIGVRGSIPTWQIPFREGDSTASWARAPRPRSNEVPPHLSVELPVLQFVPTASCPVTSHH